MRFVLEIQAGVSLEMQINWFQHLGKDRQRLMTR